MVDVNEFCRLLRVERSPFVERLFSMFDTDRGGLIDLKEFIVGAHAALGAAACAPVCSRRPYAGLANVSGDVREDKVRFAFEIFDLDNSGYIEVHELRKIVKATNLASEKQLDRKVRWLLSQCDIDGDGQIRCAARARRSAVAPGGSLTHRAVSLNFKALPRLIRTCCSRYVTHVVCCCRCCHFFDTAAAHMQAFSLAGAVRNAGVRDAGVALGAAPRFA
jgi:serine/threonine-protein phosphatase 2B regulatory subunit